MSLSFPTYPLSKKYTDETVAGGGAIKGVPCEVTDTTRRGTQSGKDGTYIDLAWELNDGTEKTGSCFVPDGAEGRGISSVVVPDPDKSEIVINYDDGTHSDPIEIPTVEGHDDSLTPQQLQTLLDMI